eukprot:TRINITY_DN13866_c0_g2_i1.p1 TRINITY_DN13866_c0_g2~~TRINITY_DN13866_c0_g2_i1.p1  ORF type:complete len:162 (+),score=32.59 TRINITY_DN13866_c0_g2_i1:40-525(+)
MCIRDRSNNILTNFIFRLFDTDGNGTIDFREFVMAIGYMNSKLNPEDEVELMFKCIDLNGDNQISKGELRDCVKLSQQLRKFSQLQDKNPNAKLSEVTFQLDEMAKITSIADGLFAELDGDKSGYVSRDEFISKVQSNDKVKQIVSSLMVKPPTGKSLFRV